MSLTLTMEHRVWPLREAFAISRSTATTCPTLVVTLTDGSGRQGRGEGCGVDYKGETPEGLERQIEAVRRRIEAGVSREQLLTLMPAGGARCAVDGALWDLEAKQTGRSAYASAGVPCPAPVRTAFTIGIRSVDDVEVAARARSRHALLKLKVDAHDPVASVMAARRGAPDAALIVDPNQSWSVAELKVLAPVLADLGVVLLEQPIPVGAEAALDGWVSPVRLCADELIDDADDLAKAQGRFDVVNIKLDKTGGLTAALGLARAARQAGFDLMVGCMAGSSLAMAPATILAQQCEFADLDGPLLAAEDWADGLTYRDGLIEPADARFWG